MFHFLDRFGALVFLTMLTARIAQAQSADVGMTAVLSDAQGVSLPAGHIYVLGELAYVVVTVTNYGPSAASGVKKYFHVQPNNALSDNNNNICRDFIGNLAVGQQDSCLTHTTIVSVAGPIAVAGIVIANEPDPNLANNTVDFILQTHAAAVALITQPTTKDSTHVALSQDGTVAVFESQETALAAGNTNTNGQDVYRVVAGQTVLENTDSAGRQLIGTASRPAVSGDGSVVAFVFASGAAKQAKDAVTSNMWAGSSGQSKHQVDIGMGGAAPNGSASGAPSVASANGSKKLVFCSAASNLVPGDTNGARDVFLVDPLNLAQATKLISTDSAGAQLPGDSCEPKMSADGSKVTFTVSASSKFGTGARQVVRKDLTTGALELISHSTTGATTGANVDSSEPAISADGGVVAFTSRASDLDALGMPVGGAEAFVSLAQSGADGTARILKRVRNGDGTPPTGSTLHPQLSDDGTILVMQTSTGVFFAPASQITACGTVAITTNFFTPAAMGSSLCTGQSGNQNPAISGDGATTGLDSNAPQTGTASSNSNPYAEGLSGLNGLGASNFNGDFSGQWFDPNQSGQGLVIDVIHPDADNNRGLLLTWFVYLNGQPTWVQGAAVAKAGSGVQAGMVVVQMDQVGIYQGKSFPLGQAHATATLWGSITLVFANASTGTMSWTSSYPGFNSGSMAITHFLPVGLPAKDAPGAQIKACYSGNWYNPTQSGHGFEFEVIPSTPPVLAVDWFAYGPTGAPVWLSGAGSISGNTVQVQLALIDGTGAQFPPKFDPAAISQHLWGTATFTFTDAAHGHVAWASTIKGYGSGELDLQPTFGPGLLDRRTCQ